MQNNQNHPVSKCQVHTFCLKALQKQRRPSLNATVTMCRSKQSKKKKNKDNCANFEAAIFNKDRCYATPAFIMPSEKIEYLATSREFIRDHDKKVKEYEQELDDLFVPKPRSKNMYCNVCRQNYEEYIDHINSPTHRSCIRGSRFNDYILDLEKKYSPNQRKQFLLSSNQTGSGFTGDDDVQIIGVRGRKRIKTSLEEEGSRPAFPNSSNFPTGLTQSNFFNSPSIPPYQLMNPLSACRNFYPPIAGQPMNPYFSYAYQNPLAMNYQFYYWPYPPANIEIYRQQF